MVVVPCREIYLMGTAAGDIRGQLPSSAVAGLTHLLALSIVDTQLTGTLPPELGGLPALKMLWLDHNRQLGGRLPPSLANLNLTVLELHFSGFSGPLPPLDYAAIPDCTMYNDRRWRNTDGNNNGNNVFDCPLPPGAEVCGAVCA